LDVPLIVIGSPAYIVEPAAGEVIAIVAAAIVTEMLSVLAGLVVDASMVAAPVTEETVIVVDQAPLPPATVAEPDTLGPLEGVKIILTVVPSERLDVPLIVTVPPEYIVELPAGETIAIVASAIVTGILVVAPRLVIDAVITAFPVVEERGMFVDQAPLPPPTIAEEVPAAEPPMVQEMSIVVPSG
jgi:hypothetical protein